MNKVLVKLENVSKKYNNKYIIKDLSIEVYQGEFLTLLGPSGCGKTTVLRMISGLETATTGKIYIDDKDVTNLDPTKRQVNTIFQNLALFPHMTVFDNIAFGLKMQKVKKEEIKTRVKKIIKLVKLEGLENRLPSQLSGGQQQRVAIARGIVTNPKVLLLDESLCSLDLKLKRQMQIELKKIQKKLGITFIYVTHDQDEALTMSDRIVILNNGLIEQNDTPENIYKKPITTFVADFIGESNIIKGRVTNITNEETTINYFDRLSLKTKNTNYNIGDKINIIIRPENIKSYATSTGVKDTIPASVTDIIYDGDVTKLIVKILDTYDLKVNIYKESVNYKQDDIIYLKFNEDTIVYIKDKRNEKR